VQVSYLGYPFSTGASAIDYHISDEVIDPPGKSDHLHVEKIIRPSKTFVTFRASSEAPAVGPLPAKANGYVTFCSFNAIWKFNPKGCALWCRVLHAVPGSKLLIKAGGLDDADTVDRIYAAFAQEKIEKDRLVL